MAAKSVDLETIFVGIMTHSANNIFRIGNAVKWIISNDDHKQKETVLKLINKIAVWSPNIADYYNVNFWLFGLPNNGNCLC